MVMNDIQWNIWILIDLFEVHIGLAVNLNVNINANRKKTRLRMWWVCLLRNVVYVSNPLYCIYLINSI